MKNSFLRGFTLIELLVVIAIIGILSSVVLANLNGSRVKARDTKRIADIKQLQLALELYYDVNHFYPYTLATGGNELAPTYIPSIPTPPAPGPSGASASYVYAPLNSGGGSCNSYHLGASLEQSSNTVLTTDSDESGGTTGTGCGGAGSAAADFDGTKAVCNDGTIAGADSCFDVTP